MSGHADGDALLESAIPAVVPRSRRDDTLLVGLALVGVGLVHTASIKLLNVANRKTRKTDTNDATWNAWLRFCRMLVQRGQPATGVNDVLSHELLSFCLTLQPSQVNMPK